ncbi:MAG: hypothetical protein F6K03_15710, partial [Kamptonema sp. SIO4C4]|nr:hypothetical protein [Kamptonema sp. SIO4C4]
NIVIPKQAQENFSTIEKTLYEYVETLATSPNDRISPIPLSLKNYLDAHQTHLATIRQYLMQVDTLNWGNPYDVTTIDIGTPIPGFLSISRFSAILMLDSLDHHLQGQDKIALMNLQNLSKVSQSLKKRPTTISHFVALHIERELAGLIRKLDDLPKNWQNQVSLLAPSDQERLFQSFRVELAVIANTLIAFNWEESGVLLVIDSEPIYNFFGYFQKPYYRLVALDILQTQNRSLEQLKTQDFCTFNSDEYANHPDLQPAWWNFFYDIWFTYQWLGFARFKLEWELTEKVQKIKTVARQQGQFPDEIAGIEQSMCDESRWVYEVNDQGKASIHLDGIPPAIRERDARSEDEVPLAYNF